MRTSIFFAATAALALVGCSKPDPTPIPDTTAGTGTGTGAATGTTTTTGTYSSTGSGTGTGTGTGAGTGTGTGTGSGTGTGTGSTTAPACSDDIHEPNEDIAGALAAILNDPSLAVTDLSDDYWSFDIPPGQQIDIDVTFTDAWGDVDVELLNAAGNQLDASTGVTDYEHLTAVNPTAANLTVYMRAWYFAASAGDCNTYEVASALTPYAAVCTDDTNEPNDDQANALAIVTGDPSLTVTSWSDDYWNVDVPANSATTVDLLFVDADGDIDVEVLDSAGYVVDGEYSVSDNESVGAINATGAPETYTVHVYHFAASLGDCNTYELQVTDAPLPVCAEDANEPNDTMGTAMALLTSTPLAVTDISDDVWSFDVPTDTRTTLDISFLDVVSNIDVWVEDSTGAYVDGGYSDDNDETVEVINTTGASATYYLYVELGYNYAATATCNTYEVARTDVAYP